MRHPYSLFKQQQKSGLTWFARFWDESLKRYAISRSLHIPVEGIRERRREAVEAARIMAEEFKKNPPIRRTAADTPLVKYLSSFWTSESDYAQEQLLVNKMPLSTSYIKGNAANVKLHITPFFKTLTLGDLTRKHIREFKLWAAKQGKSGNLINECLKTMRVPVRVAVANGDIQTDPFLGAGKAFHKEKEKGVLTLEERAALTNATAADPYARLSVLLGLLCGMRLGEVRGLRWGDIGDGMITIRHNYVDGDGDKFPKRKGGLIQENTRIVPMPRIIAQLLNKIAPNAGTDADAYIIRRPKNMKGPASSGYFKCSLHKELAGIGITIEEQKKRNLTFHSMRHTFVTLGRILGLTDIEIQTLAGHSARMMERYSHAGQVIDVKSAGQKLENYLPAALPVQSQPRPNPQAETNRRGDY